MSSCQGATRTAAAIEPAQGQAPVLLQESMQASLHHRSSCKGIAGSEDALLHEHTQAVAVALR